MIVVTGTTGQLGGAVAERLLALRGPAAFTATARRPDGAGALAERGVRILAADYGDPASLRAAFAGAEQLFLVSANSTGDEVLRLHGHAVDAARGAGVGRVVYTSHMGARDDSAFSPMPGHAATERMLGEAGVAFTSLRHGFYAASGLMLIERGLRAGELRVPEDGPVSWTTHADLAEADAILLTEPGRTDGATPPLTAGRAFTMAELAAIASDLSGREIRHRVVGDREWRDALVADGAPPERAAMLLGLFQAARRGDFAATDPLLESLIGRPPQTMRDVLAARLVE